MDIVRGRNAVHRAVDHLVELRLAGDRVDVAVQVLPHSLHHLVGALELGQVVKEGVDLVLDGVLGGDVVHLLCDLAPDGRHLLQCLADVVLQGRQIILRVKIKFNIYKLILDFSHGSVNPWLDYNLLIYSCSRY